MAIGTLFGGSIFGWILAGAALYFAFANTGMNITQPKFDQFSDPGVGGGPWTAPTTSGTTIPLCFGTMRYPLPIIHHRLDGDDFRNMWIVAAVGEDWGSLSGGEYSTEIEKLWINDYDIKNLTDYTDNEDLKDRNHTWYKFFPSGLGAYFEWDSTGKHSLVSEAAPGETTESYTLICTHNADIGAGPVHVKIRTMHQWDEGGAEQKWRIRVEYLEDIPGLPEPPVLYAPADPNEWFSYFFTETQTVEAGKSSETYDVAGTKSRTAEFDLPYRGKFKVVLENGSGVIDPSDPLYGTDPPIVPNPDDYSYTIEEIYHENYVEYRKIYEQAYHDDMDQWKIDIVAWAKANADQVDSYLAGLKESNFVYWFFAKILIEKYSLSNRQIGKMYLDSIDISDPGQAYEQVNSNGTSLVLIRIIDNTGELARPAITGLVHGGPSNPAEAMQWLMTDTELGACYDTEHIDLGSFMEAADECDGYGYTFNRAYCNAATLETVMKDISMSARLNLCDWNGLITLFMDNEIEHTDLPEVWLENTTEAKSVGYGKSSLKDIPNSFDIKYVDKAIEYTAQDLVTENAELITQAGLLNKVTVNLTGITTMAQAWEVGWYQIQYAQADKYLEFAPLPMLWKIQPGQPFIARSNEDPYIDNTEWVVVAIDEKNAATYRCRCIPYPRQAWSPPSLNEWIPDVYIPGPTPTPDMDQGRISASLLTVNHTVNESSTEGHVLIDFTISNVPPEAIKVRVYRSYLGYLDEGGDLSGYESVGDIHYPNADNNHFRTLEPIRYIEVRYRFTVVDKEKNIESSLSAAKLVVVFPYTDTDPELMPGYGAGEYGLVPYGG